MFQEENLININKKFASGKIVNKKSIETALSSPEQGWMDQVANLVRALILDHVFEDGNKRTAPVIIAAYYTEFEVGFDTEKITEMMIKMQSKNIKDIDEIKGMIKDVIK